MHQRVFQSNISRIADATALPRYGEAKKAVIGKIRYAYLAMTGRYNDLDRRPAIANGSCELQAVNAARHIDIGEDHLNSWVDAIISMASLALAASKTANPTRSRWSAMSML